MRARALAPTACAVALAISGCGSSKPVRRPESVAYRDSGLAPVVSLCETLRINVGRFEHRGGGLTSARHFKQGLRLIADKSLPLVTETIVKIRHVDTTARARPVVRDVLTNLENSRASLRALEHELNRTHGDSYLDFQNGTLTRFFEADAGCMPARKPIKG